jgi:hypothetical protein
MKDCFYEWHGRIRLGLTFPLGGVGKRMKEECYKICIMRRETDIFYIFADAKISCTSAMQENKRAYFFVLHSVCIIFAP